LLYQLSYIGVYLYSSGSAVNAQRLPR